jgi:hypothetical protein
MQKQSGRKHQLRRGHGYIGAPLDEQIEQDADGFGFLFDRLGVQYAPAGK